MPLIPAYHEAMDDFIGLGGVARSRCNEQMQYVARVIQANPGVFDALRIRGNPREYHEMLIHKDDVEAFVSMYLCHNWRLLTLFVISTIPKAGYYALALCLTLFTKTAKLKRTHQTRPTG